MRRSWCITGTVMWPPFCNADSRQARGAGHVPVAVRCRSGSEASFVGHTGCARRGDGASRRSVGPLGLQVADSAGERLEDAGPDARELVHERMELAMAEDEERRRRVRRHRRRPRALRRGARSRRRSRRPSSSRPWSRRGRSPTAPSTRTKNSRPVSPSRIRTRPAGTSISSTSIPTASISFRPRPSRSGVRLSSSSFWSICVAITLSNLWERSITFGCHARTPMAALPHPRDERRRSPG